MQRFERLVVVVVDGSDDGRLYLLTFTTFDCAKSSEKIVVKVCACLAFLLEDVLNAKGSPRVL